jgi:peptidoglycan/xylan/chitin deacetylase (PgdA/CDA1 family)
VISFTFDDVPASAATVGAEILEKAGALGTFYIAGSLCEGSKDPYRLASVAELIGLRQRGHELACHTYSHVSVLPLRAPDLEAEVRRNQAFFNTHFDDLPLRNFAYPFGDVSLSSKLFLERQFASCRGTISGLNTGVIDLGLLKAERLYERLLTPQLVADRIERAGAACAWLIFYTHDVEATPSEWGVSPDLLRFAVTCAKERGIEVLPVRNALARVAYG